MQYRYIVIFVKEKAQQVAVLMTATQKRRITTAAKKRKLPFSQFVREAALERAGWLPAQLKDDNRETAR
jgi:uncharacterized protein (DUF1778 family)